MEIEKKYLVPKLPELSADCEKWEIEQYYLCSKPTIRIRKKNEEYILTYKNHRPDKTADLSLCVADEVEMPLTAEAFEHLKAKSDGIGICKTRYRIPYEKYTIELDVFHEDYEGFCMAEVEFPTIDESTSFCPPDWFGKDVSGDVHYTNSYLSKKNLAN